VEASRVEGGGYLSPSRLAPGELIGMISAAVLALSLFLPWFGTSSTNSNSSIDAAHVTGGGTATAWATFPILRFVLLAGCIAPFVLAWIVARRHKLTWQPGEVTMIVGVTTFILILCNGLILGKPENEIEISFQYGYLVGILGAVGIAVGGYLRQSRGEKARKPPGEL
jgi:hypothetical protein